MCGTYALAVAWQKSMETETWPYRFPLRFASKSRGPMRTLQGRTPRLKMESRSIRSYIIRNKMYHGLLSGKISMRSLYDDERLKMTVPQACYYCGHRDNLTVDHLVPLVRGGPDEADNLIWACRSCNSSKHGRDMLVWANSKGIFPSILLLRRYMKIVARFCEEKGHMDINLENFPETNAPFDVRLLPTKFPPLPELTLWVKAK